MTEPQRITYLRQYDVSETYRHAGKSPDTQTVFTAEDAARGAFELLRAGGMHVTIFVTDRPEPPSS